jgi:hypothetical protein
MTDRTQFEAMLEALINEDQETAQEIFHNIVVAKSREIYEELLSEDFDLEEGENPFAKADDSEEEEPTDDGEEEPTDDGEESDDVGGDATDDFIDDVTDGEEDEEGGESEEGADDQEARIMDLEDALEELKAEFEQLMADEGNEPEMNAEPEMDGMDGMDAMGGAGEPDELERMMEYTQKVALPKHGDNGANSRSIVAKPNNMGGTTANIAKSFSTTSGGADGGLAKTSTTLQNAGNINVPGGKAGKTAFKKTEPGHGAEKKGSREQADNKKSIVGGK